MQLKSFFAAALASVLMSAPMSIVGHASDFSTPNRGEIVSDVVSRAKLIVSCRIPDLKGDMWLLIRDKSLPPFEIDAYSKDGRKTDVSASVLLLALPDDGEPNPDVLGAGLYFDEYLETDFSFTMHLQDNIGLLYDNRQFVREIPSDLKIELDRKTGQLRMPKGDARDCDVPDQAKDGAIRAIQYMQKQISITLGDVMEKHQKELDARKF